MRRISRVLALATLATAAVFAPSASFAHTEIVSATPAADSTVNAGVIDIDLTFGENLLESADSQGSAIQITDDSTGDTVYVDCVYVSGAHLYAKAGLYANGPVTLTWRTVADDGHAVSDSYTFTVNNPNNETLGDTTGFCPEGQVYATNEVAVMKYNTAPEAVSDKPAKKTSDNGLLVGLGFGVVVVFLFALVGALQTKRRWAKEDAAKAKKKK